MQGNKNALYRVMYLSRYALHPWENYGPNCLVVKFVFSTTEMLRKSKVASERRDKDLFGKPHWCIPVHHSCLTKDALFHSCVVNPGREQFYHSDPERDMRFETKFNLDNKKPLQSLQVWVGFWTKYFCFTLRKTSIQFSRDFVTFLKSIWEE